MTQLIMRFLRDEQGQDIIEYALVGTFVSIGALFGAQQLAIGYNNWFGDVKTWVEAVGPKAP